MELYTYKARSLAEALRLVRDELGPDASLLYTREIGSPLARWLGVRTIEVTASAEACAPSRLPKAVLPPIATSEGSDQNQWLPPVDWQRIRDKLREDVAHASQGVSLVEQMATADQAQQPLRKYPQPQA